jgi:tetratricopeptide (TPR) repeat protein
MVGRRPLALVLALAGLCVLARAQASNPSNSDRPENTAPNSSQESPQGTGSTEVIHRKTGPASSETIRHTRVLDEGSTPPELTRAEELIQKQDYAGAEPLLHKVVAGTATSYVAWFDLGYVENSLGKIAESIAAYRKSVAAKPDVFESNLNLGLQLAKQGHPDAETFLRAATELKPTSHAAEGQARAWLSLAHVIEDVKPDDALAAYRQAAILQPNDPEPHLAAGLLLEKQKKFSDAEQEYKTALAIDRLSDAMTGLANLYMNGRRFPDAEEYLRKLTAAHPEQAMAHIELGRVLAAESKTDAAIAELEAGAKLAPQDPAVQREVADLYLEAGKAVLAETAYRALVLSKPDDPVLHHALGKALLHQKKFPAAEQEFLTAVKLKPDYGEAYGDLAFAASENKDYPLTIKALDFRVKYLPDVDIIYFLRASAYDHLRDYKKAAVNFHLFLNTAHGKYPDQEWQAKHRLITIEPKK